jgi:hypothetical protein
MYARIRNVKEPRIQSAIGGVQDEHRDFTACTGSLGGDLRIGGVRALPPFVLFFAEDFACPIDPESRLTIRCAQTRQ